MAIEYLRCPISLYLKDCHWIKFSEAFDAHEAILFEYLCGSLQICANPISRGNKLYPRSTERGPGLGRIALPRVAQPSGTAKGRICSYSYMMQVMLVFLSLISTPNELAHELAIYSNVVSID